jgi:Domain of unknown function (DUF2019)
MAEIVGSAGQGRGQLGLRKCPLPRFLECYKRLRESDAGRRAISGLIYDPVTAVRLSAASHSLAWQPVAAQAVLEEIENQPTGLYAVSAKWTLRSYRQGKLNLDW